MNPVFRCPVFGWLLYLITQLEFVDSFLSSGQIFSIVLNLRQNDIGILESLEILFGVLGVGKV